MHRIQQAGIEVMAGMIVGFDNDDPSIFEEQFRFIQDARIPVSMTGMLNAMPKTPLYQRLKEAGRLIAESVGDQFVFTNIVPKGMSRLELYEGYKTLLQRLYSYRNYRQRAMELILNKGGQPSSRGCSPGARSSRIFLRILWTCMLRASPRRAWLTLSLIVETALRRPARPARRGDLRPHAQAPLRVHARHLGPAGGAHPGTEGVPGLHQPRCRRRRRAPSSWGSRARGAERIRGRARGRVSETGSPLGEEFRRRLHEARAQLTPDGGCHRRGAGLARG